MWYVMQVRVGTEENIRCQCERTVEKGILERCFIPYYEEKKKYEGKWHTQEKILFPGYVFMITDFWEELYESLKHVIGLTKLLGTGSEVVPLSEEEVRWLLRMGKEDQVVEMSEGVIENGTVHITSGPLMGMEGNIHRIDRHKRKAYLKVEMFGRTIDMQVGLEIVSKIYEKEKD